LLWLFSLTAWSFSVHSLYLLASFLKSTKAALRSSIGPSAKAFNSANSTAILPHFD